MSSLWRGKEVPKVGEDFRLARGDFREIADPCRAGRPGGILSKPALDARLEETADTQRRRVEAMWGCLEKLPDDSTTTTVLLPEDVRAQCVLKSA